MKRILFGLAVLIGAAALFVAADPQTHTFVAQDQVTSHFIASPLICADSSGSGTAQSCTTSPTFTPASGDVLIYSTTTTNTGALTLNANASGAASVKKWMSSAALVSGDVPSGVPMLAIYDGADWNIVDIGNAPTGGGTLWSTIGNPGGNLALTMGSNLTEFDYTTALSNAWKLAVNITAATVTTPQASPVVNLVCGTDWTGAGASTQGCATVQYTPAVGLNTQATVTFDLVDSSSNTNIGFFFNKKIYNVAGGSFNIGVQGSRNAAFDQSGVELGTGARGLYFSNTGNLDTGGIDAGFTRLGANLLSASNGSANNSGGLLHTGSDVFVASNFTTAANTSLQTITGLSWTVPSTVNAIGFSFTCHLVYSQATATAAVAFGIQAATTAPSNIFARGLQQNSTTTPFFAAPGILATLTTTTATNIVSATPGVIGTNYTVDLSGTIENPATTPNVFNIMTSTATSGDAVTVLRGSYCQLF